MKNNNLMTYQKSQMIYSDYTWLANANHDTPKLISSQDVAMLNRKEGHEMLYIINSLSLTWNWNANLASRQRLEYIIRAKVPAYIRTIAGIKNWIQENYTQI